MNRESLEKLKLDRRLIRRSQWISPTELQRELEALRDVSHKIATIEQPDEANSESEESPVE
jgi:hypothetical protein